MAIPAALQAIARFQPEIVHAQGTVLPVIERRFYRSLKGPRLIATVHDVRAHERRPWLGSFDAFYREFDHLICHSESSMRRLTPHVRAVPISVVPHGIFSPLAGTPVAPEEARRRLSLPAQARVVLFFGFIRRYKGLDRLLDAVALARRGGHHVTVLVAGRPLYDIRSSIERASAEGLDVRWHLGFIPREALANYFAAADVVALPYLDTSDSGAFELAAAFRRPVVATAAGGLAEAFARYQYGALVPVDDSAALAQAIIRVYDATLQASRSVNSWEAVAAQSEEVYRIVLERRAA